MAAWAPVGFDAACLVLAFAVLYRPFQSIAETFNFPVWATAVSLLAIGFIPIQAVLIFSSLWAAKSRFTDDNTDV
ncbi:hypothetical protein KO486_04425 [Octadecabacter sp. B2R22]|nr:hypothetical protein [Octadecabacter sp. B2R22]